MKKFITFTLCLLLCVVTLGLTACGKSKNETVNTSIDSFGNGGTVVTRGDYVYFVNGYKSYSVFNKNNLKTKFEVGGLYRAKVNSNGELSYDENGSVSGAERISSKLAGFESTSLYVFGNHIYYATPITEVTKKGNLQNKKIEFRRVNIGGGSTERIYKSKVDATNVKFEFYYAEGKVYLLINENGTLKRVTCTGDFSSTTIAKNVTSVTMTRDEDYVFESDSYKNIFYTKKNDDGKVEIYNYNIATNRKEYKKTTDYTNCELVNCEFGYLYYKVKGTENSTDYTYFYRIAANKNAIMDMDAYQITNDMGYTDIILLENETDGYFANTDSKTYYLNYSSGAISPAIPMGESKLEIMAIKNGYVYVKSNTTINRINISKLKTTGDILQEEVITVEGVQSYTYDIDDNNLYVYATKGSNTYLYSVGLNNIDGEDFEQKLLGVYDSADAPTND